MNKEDIYLTLVKEATKTKNEEELRVLLVEKLKLLSPETKEMFYLERDRVDIKYKDVVIETKRYGRINKNNSNFEDFEKQTIGYMKKLNIPYGVLTDCKSIYFYKVDEDGVIKKIDTENSFSFENFEYLQSILFGEEKDKYLVTSNLIYDFANLKNNPQMRDFLKKLLDLFESSENPKKELFFQEWEKLFRLSEADKDEETSTHEDIQKRRDVLVDIFDREIDETNEYKALFVLFTALSIIVKLLIFTLMKESKKQKIDKSINDYKTLKELFKGIELGFEYEKLGIVNMGKSDFFSWYIEIKWDEELFCLMKSIFLKSVGYKIVKWEDLKDPIKDLYQDFIDFDIRHSLGEYYTPQGLADFLVNRTITKDDKTLDPTCGSGTFITSLLKHKLKDKSLKDILNNNEVIGIDLNPIAVIMAKLNFLLTVYKNMIDEDINELEIPIFLGDSSYMPTIKEKDGVKYIEYQYYLDGDKIDIPKIIFPVDFVKDKKFVLVLNEVEQMIFDNKTLTAIHRYLIGEIKKVSKIEKSVENEIKELISKIIEYHKDNLNTIWLFIFMNYLKPFSLSPFDKAIGNPPWVRWSVLPIKYKERIKNTLRDDGLFSSDKNHGGIDLNICALIANRVLDNLLDIDSRLIFLMPQSILYNKSFEGFRKLKLHNARGKILQVFKPEGKVFKDVDLPFLIYDIKKCKSF